MDQSRQPPPAFPAPLTDAEIEEILDDLDGFETPEEVIAQRTQERRPYQAQLSVVCEVEGEEACVRFTAMARDLSAGGIGLIAPHGCDVGTHCTITLVDAHGCEESISGRVVLCAPFEGRAYLWGVQFEEFFRAEVFLQSRRAG